MADYYTKVSFLIDLGKDANEYVSNIRNELIDFVSATDDEHSASSEAIELAEAYSADDLGVGFHVTTEPNGLWVHGDEHPNIELVAGIIQKAMSKYDVDQIISFEWTHDCSKPRLDAYGGGAVIITKDEIAIRSTVNFIDEYINALKNSQEPTSPTP